LRRFAISLISHYEELDTQPIFETLASVMVMTLCLS